MSNISLLKRLFFHTILYGSAMQCMHCSSCKVVIRDPSSNRQSQRAAKITDPYQSTRSGPKEPYAATSVNSPFSPFTLPTTKIPDPPKYKSNHTEAQPAATPPTPSETIPPDPINNFDHNRGDSAEEQRSEEAQKKPDPDQIQQQKQPTTQQEEYPYDQTTHPVPSAPPLATASNDDCSGSSVLTTPYPNHPPPSYYANTPPPYTPTLQEEHE